MSASSVPFTPSSPLLSCSQEGSRHAVISTPVARDSVWAVQVQECVLTSALPHILQSKLSRHGSGADSDYENTQSGDPLLG